MTEMEPSEERPPFCFIDFLFPLFLLILLLVILFNFKPRKTVVFSFNTTKIHLNTII